MPFTEVELNQARSKAMVHLMATPDSSFFVTVAFSMQYEWDYTIPTACTNGLKVLINPEFFMPLTVEERVFLIIHEACHVAYMHICRLMDRELKRFNLAGDHVINLMLIKRGFKMPKGGYADRQYIGMGTEQVYDLLPPDQVQNFQMDMEPFTGDPEELQREVEDIIVRASIQSKLDEDRPGTIPGEIELFLENLLKPKLPWHRILQKYIQQLSKNDYSFRKPNRRFFPQHYLSSLYSEKVINMTIAVDISGSVSDTEFHQFVSEIGCILKMMKPEEIQLIQFDTTIHSIEKLKSIPDLMKVKFTGRGGTDIGELMELVNKQKPQLTLVFTDGGFSFNNYESKQNIVWLIHNNPNWKAKFGKTIHYHL